MLRRCNHGENEMAAKRPVKKTGKKVPLRKGGQRKQAAKPIGRKSPVGSGRKSAQRSPRARKTGKSARPTTREPMGLRGTAAAAKIGESPRKTPAPARKAVRSGATTARKTRKDQRTVPIANEPEA
jgi:hypothetical protein